MSERVCRQLADELPRLDTAAGDSVLRLAMGLWCADVRAPLTHEQRQWVLERLCPRLTVEEKARIREPLLAYIETYHPRIVEIVRTQFPEPKDNSEH